MRRVSSTQTFRWKCSHRLHPGLLHESLQHGRKVQLIWWWKLKSMELSNKVWSSWTSEQCKQMFLWFVSETINAQDPRDCQPWWDCNYTWFSSGCPCHSNYSGKQLGQDQSLIFLTLWGKKKKHFLKYYLLIKFRAELKPINYCEKHFHWIVQDEFSTLITHKIINMSRVVCRENMTFSTYTGEEHPEHLC